MFRKPKYNKTLLRRNEEVQADQFHIKIRKMLENKEPIESITPLIYTARKDGVLPQYNIRTDKFEIAMMARDEVTGTITAKVKESIEKKETETETEAEEKK